MRTINRLLLSACALLAGFCIAEMASTVMVTLHFGTASVPQLLAGEKNNTYLTDGLASGKQPYLKTLYPHPYLAYVHSRQGGGTNVNNIGLVGRDFPVERDPGRFTIL